MIHIFTYIFTFSYASEQHIQQLNISVKKHASGEGQRHSFKMTSHMVVSI